MSASFDSQGTWNFTAPENVSMKSFYKDSTGDRSATYPASQFVSATGGQAMSGSAGIIFNASSSSVAIIDPNNYRNNSPVLPLDEKHSTPLSVISFSTAVTSGCKMGVSVSYSLQFDETGESGVAQLTETTSFTSTSVAHPCSEFLAPIQAQIRAGKTADLVAPFAGFAAAGALNVESLTSLTQLQVTERMDATRTSTNLPATI